MDTVLVGMDMMAIIDSNVGSVGAEGFHVNV